MRPTVVVAMGSYVAFTFVFWHLTFHNQSINQPINQSIGYHIELSDLPIERPQAVVIHVVE